jgi:hypothetical protein
MTTDDLDKNPDLVIRLTKDAVEKSKIFLELCERAATEGFSNFSQVDSITGEREDYTIIKGNVIAYRTDHHKISTIVNMDNDTIVGWEYKEQHDE